MDTHVRFTLGTGVHGRPYKREYTRRIGRENGETEGVAEQKQGVVGGGGWLTISSFLDDLWLAR